MDGISLKEFFEPSSVAVVGASADPNKIGHAILRNMVEAGYAGKLFAVNPRIPEVLGIKTYSSVEELPEPIDLAIVVLPAELVLSVIRECSRKKVKAAVIISGGFREVGEKGKELEKALLKTVRETGMRVIGPNCQGINNPRLGLRATFGGLAKSPGPIGMISQSGTLGAAIQCWADREGVGISKCVNLGNNIDVNETDLLQYLKDDKDTKVIVLYIEGVADGRSFINVASEVSRIKPVVALKGGTTKASLKAVASHTSSLAGNMEIFEAAFRKAGIMRANSLEELYDVAKAFAFLPLPEGPGVLIIESTGGAGILASDMCEKLGLKLPEPDENARNKLKQVLSGFCTFSNPFDLASEAFTPDRFKLVIEENMRNDAFHAFITIFGDPIPDAAEQIRKVVQKTTKPVLVSYLGGGEVESREAARMQALGIPVFPTPDRAVVALSCLVKYSEYLRRRIAYDIVPMLSIHDGFVDHTN